ncbi:FadR/GntR family transcriptional regulator [Chitinophaga lutea]
MAKTSLSKLTPIDTQTQVDKIELTLQEYFLKENFQPGDAIPKEVELAEALGVSRTAIREALSRFKTLGIIESRKNRGMVVTSPDIFSNMKRVLELQLIDGDTMKEMFEMRLVLEMGIVDILFLRKDAASLRKLEEIVKKEELAQSNTERLKYDVEFHAMLYKISGNTTIQRFQKMLLPIFDYVANDIHVESQVKNANFVTHRILLRTLEEGTPEEFRIKMKQHLMKYFEKIKALYA